MFAASIISFVRPGIEKFGREIAQQSWRDRYIATISYPYREYGFQNAVMFLIIETTESRIYEMEPVSSYSPPCTYVARKKCKPNTHQIEEPFQCERRRSSASVVPSFFLSFVSNDHTSSEVHHWARPCTEHEGRFTPRTI